MQTFDSLADTHRAHLSRLHRVTLAIQTGYFVPIDVEHLGKESERTLDGILIFHLRLDMNNSLVPGDVKVGGIDIGAGGAQVRIEWQRLVEFVGQMQIHILRQTAIVGIEVLVVPLIAAVERTVTILPRVVATHGNYVFTYYNIRCKVKAESHHAIVAETDMMAVQPHIGTLSGTLELDKHLSVCLIGTQTEVLAIPADGVGQVDDIFLEGLAAIEGIGQRYPLPTVVIIIGLCRSGHVSHCQAPVGIEIERLPFCRRCR